MISSPRISEFNAGKALRAPMTALVKNDMKPRPTPWRFWNASRRRARMSMMADISASLNVVSMAAVLTTFNEADMSAIIDIRARRREAFQKRHGVGLGFMSFFTKAVIGALRAFPALNSEIRGDEIIQKNYY